MDFNLRPKRKEELRCSLTVGFCITILQNNIYHVLSTSSPNSTSNQLAHNLFSRDYITCKYSLFSSVIKIKPNKST